MTTETQMSESGTTESAPPRVVLITGIMAAGKSTVAQALAEALPRSVHVRGDVFRRFVVSGREEMSEAPSPEALAQLALRYEFGAMTARRYHEAGFHVVYQDVILGEALGDVVERLRDLPLTVVVLCPSAEVVSEREATRAKRGYGAWEARALDASFRETTPRIGCWLDTSRLSVGETVARILELLDEPPPRAG